MRSIFNAIKEIILGNSDMEAVFPVHLNPKVRELAREIFFGGTERVHLINPLDYEPFATMLMISNRRITAS